MSWKDTTLSSFLIVICSFSDYFSIKHRTWQVQATCMWRGIDQWGMGSDCKVWFIRYFHQSRIPNLRMFLLNICYDFFFNWNKTQKELSPRSLDKMLLKRQVNSQNVQSTQLSKFFKFSKSSKFFKLWCIIFKHV